MIRTLMTASAALALVAAANAGEPAKKGAVKMKTDAQPSMTVGAVKTREDALKLGEDEFTLADVDADGFLTETEFAKLEAMQAKPAGALTATPAAAPSAQFPAIAGEDGKISREELAAARVASFDAADADLNRVLSDSERRVFASLVAPPQPETPNF